MLGEGFGEGPWEKSMKLWIRKLESTGLLSAFTFGWGPGTPASETTPLQFPTVEKDQEPDCIPSP